MPQLNMTAAYSLSGTGGPAVENGVVTVPGGYGDALKSLASFDKPNWSIGFNMTYPLGMVGQKVAVAQAELRLEQARANLKVQELTVSTDITTAAQTVQSNYASLALARRAREVAEKNLEAEQTKYDLGMSNNYNVATAQNNVTTQRLNELNAIIRYVNSVADFEKKLRIGG